MTQTLRQLLQRVTLSDDILQIDVAKLQDFHSQGAYREFFAMHNFDGLRVKIKRLIQTAKNAKNGAKRESVLNAELSQSTELPNYTGNTTGTEIENVRPPGELFIAERKKFTHQKKTRGG